MDPERGDKVTMTCKFGHFYAYIQLPVQINNLDNSTWNSWSLFSACIFITWPSRVGPRFSKYSLPYIFFNLSLILIRDRRVQGGDLSLSLSLSLCLPPFSSINFRLCLTVNVEVEISCCLVGSSQTISTVIFKCSVIYSLVAYIIFFKNYWK